MAAHDLFPGFIQITYTSIFAVHKMTLPTRMPVAGLGPLGGVGYEAWDTTAVDAVLMVAALVDALKSLVPTSCNFANYTVFKVDSPGDPPHPIESAVIDTDGLQGTPGWFEAVQGIWTFYDTAFFTAKINLLDMASLNNYARRSASTLSTDEQAVADVYMDASWAFSSRAGYRPVTVRSLSLGINDALKKQYPGI